jgi:hypothetical protein
MGRWRLTLFIQPRDWWAGYTYQWRKKKDKQDCKEIKEEKINFSVGQLVTVMNHGDAWTHCAHIISLNVNENTAMIKWEITRKCDYVEITDLKKTQRWKPNKENKRRQSSSILFL